MSAITPSRRDPAPSRLRYRMHRMWLTPRFRAFVRYVLPALVVLAIAAAYWSDQDNRDAVQGAVHDAVRSFQERPEFMVTAMQIDGASSGIAEDIAEIVPVEFPISSFDLDLDGMKDRISELDAVAQVTMQVGAGGLLKVSIAERVPAAVWRVGDTVELLDAEGHRVAVVESRAARPDLPLVVGAGAPEAMPQALRLIAAAEPVADRLRGLVRVGERRWDMVLDRDQRILLPETGAVQALEQVMALEEAEDLLSRTVSVVDFRNRTRPTLRILRPDPAAGEFGETE